ncbi:MAG: serine hydrolase domain-containing protein [Actinomycetales bacterium]
MRIGVAAFAVLWCLLAAGLAGPSSAAATSAPPQEQAVVVRQAEPLPVAAERLQSDLRAPGLAVIELAAGAAEVTYLGQDGDGRPIGPSTPFVWGSVSKSFAALTLSRLDEQGIVSLDTPVASVLPGLEGTELERNGVLVSDLVTHTSGLPNDLSLTDRWGDREPALARVPQVAQEPLGQRGQFVYSSLNYLLVQAVVEQVTGGSYPEAVDQEVGAPVGAGAFIADPAGYEAIPAGHVPFFTRPMPITVGVDTAGIGYGYLAGSGEQLQAYVAWQLEDQVSQAPDSIARRSTCADTGWGAEYCDGWFREVREVGGEQVGVVRHSGAVPGYYTHVLMAPSQQRAWIVLSNRYGELEATGYDSAVTQFVNARLAGQVSEGASASTPMPLLGTLLAALGAAVIGFVLAMRSTVRGRRRQLAPAAVRLRLLAYLALALGVVAAGAWGVPAVFGTGLITAWRWAPDAVLLVWLLLAILLLTLIVLAIRDARRTVPATTASREARSHA